MTVTAGRCPTCGIVNQDLIETIKAQAAEIEKLEKQVNEIHTKIFQL